MSRKHRNNFRTTLNGSITDVATSITLNNSFTAIASGETLSLTIYGAGVYEIISIPYAGIGTAPTYTSVARGQEGTTAVAWADGSKVECRVTRDSIDTKQDNISGLAVTSATPALDDKVLFQDTDDSDNMKQAALSAFTTINTFTFIEAKTASASATLDFTDLGDYAKVIFMLCDLIPATDNQRLYIRTSTDNGSNYDAGASDYAYTFNSAQMSSGTFSGTAANGATEMHACSGVGNDVNEMLNGEINLYNPTAATFKMLEGKIISVGATAIPTISYFSGVRKAAADVNAIRFLFASGNITSGTIYAYGIKKS